MASAVTFDSYPNNEPGETSVKKKLGLKIGAGVLAVASIVGVGINSFGENSTPAPQVAAGSEAEANPQANPAEIDETNNAVAPVESDSFSAETPLGGVLADLDKIGYPSSYIEYNSALIESDPQKFVENVTNNLSLSINTGDFKFFENMATSNGSSNLDGATLELWESKIQQVISDQNGHYFTYARPVLEDITTKYTEDGKPITRIGFTASFLQFDQTRIDDEDAYQGFTAEYTLSTAGQNLELLIDQSGALVGASFPDAIEF